MFCRYEGCDVAFIQAFDRMVVLDCCERKKEATLNAAEITFAKPATSPAANSIPR